MKWIKRILQGLGVLLVLGAASGTVHFYVLHPRVSEPPKVTAPKTADAIKRGRYLARSLGCIACHTPIDETRPGDFIIEEKLLSGRVIAGQFPGRMVAHNLTPDPETGIGSWSDGVLVRAIREGIGHDGRPLFPLMNYPAFRHLSLNEVLWIIAYLRSVKPIRHDLPETEVEFPVSMFIRTVPQPVDEASGGLPEQQVARGRQLMEMMGCVECHTPKKMGRNIEGMELAGGMVFTLPGGQVRAPNITSDPEAGIGGYSDEELMRVFREGKNKAGRTLWVMPWSIYQHTKEEDLRAIIAALRAVPPNPHKVAPNTL